MHNSKCSLVNYHGERKMNYLLTDIGHLLGLIYTIALLGHILYKGFIRKTEDAYVRDNNRRMK